MASKRILLLLISLIAFAATDVLAAKAQHAAFHQQCLQCEPVPTPYKTVEGQRF